VHRQVILSVNLSNGGYKISQFLIFQDGDCPQSWIGGAYFAITEKEDLKVFIVVQNVVEIASVALKIRKLEYTAHLAYLSNWDLGDI